MQILKYNYDISYLILSLLDLYLGSGFHYFPLSNLIKIKKDVSDILSSIAIAPKSGLREKSLPI